MEGIQRRKLYPERASEGITTEIEHLSKVISGEIPPWNVTEEERSEIVKLESVLAEKLESVFSMTPRGISLNLEYLLSEKGSEDFTATTGIKLPEEINDTHSLRMFLYQHTETLSSVEQRKLAPLGGRSSKHWREKAHEAVIESLNDSGEIDTTLLPENNSVSLRLTPREDYEKVRQLRDLKTEIKLQRELLKGYAHSADHTEMLDGILELYQRKINTLIASHADAFVPIRAKAEVLGEDALTEEEKLALTQDRSSDVVASLARYDKFLYGASSESDAEGWKKQISSSLTALADTREKILTDALLEKEQAIAENGLDATLLENPNIEPHEIEKMCSETLAHYGLLSEHPPSEYTPNRQGPAPDGKWQFIIQDTYKNLSVSGKQKVIKCPNEPQSVARLLSITIGHEIEGHVIQHENKSKIPLRLFEKVGSDRSSIFAEAGAMSNQDHVTQSAFGYQSPSKPHYVRAMLKKLEGGNYADCMGAYYASIVKPLRMQYEQGLIDVSTFKKECAKAIKTSISSTGRLFHGEESKSDLSSHLVNSKASVYIEQTKLAEALQERGLDKMLNLTGVNASSLELLFRAKLLDVEDIQTPDFYSLKLWDEMKERYTKSDV